MLRARPCSPRPGGLARPLLPHQRCRRSGPSPCAGLSAGGHRKGKGAPPWNRRGNRQRSCSEVTPESLPVSLWDALRCRSLSHPTPVCAAPWTVSPKPEVGCPGSWWPGGGPPPGPPRVPLADFLSMSSESALASRPAEWARGRGMAVGPVFTGDGQATCTSPRSSRGHCPPPSTGQGAQEPRRPLVSSRKRPRAGGRHFRPWTGAR